MTANGANYSIAVIGSGMAGLAAAYKARCSGHAVTVFEARGNHGMDAHSLTAGNGLVDVPLRVLSPDSWPSVLQLATAVGVDTFDVKTHSSCSWTNGATWFRSSTLPLLHWPVVGSWRYLNRRALRLGFGLWQLRRITAGIVRQPSDVTLAQVLKQHSFDRLFWRGLILPILTTICTCEEKHLLNWPARQLLPLLHSILHGKALCRLTGGTPALAKQLAKGLRFFSNSPVQQLRYVEQGVAVSNARGEGGIFDRVIVATQANQLDFLDQSQFSHERQILSTIRFDSGELWVHQDNRLMPARQQDWTALNFQMDKALRKPMFTVWVNQVEPSLYGREAIFQTWDPLFAPDNNKVLARIPLQRAVVHAGTASVHAALTEWHLQPGRKVFFCGSWAHDGVPLLESAVRSANAVVNIINLQRQPLRQA